MRAELECIHSRRIGIREYGTCQKRGCQPIVDGAVWEKVTKGRAGIRWDSVAEKVWKGIGRNQEDVMSAGKFGRHKAEVEERVDIREVLALSIETRWNRKKTFRDIRGIAGRDRNENVFARPNGLRENAEAALSCR